MHQSAGPLAGLFLLPTLLSGGAPLGAQERFADPQGRYTVPVPAHWTARTVLDATVVLTREPATITVSVGREADPATAVRETMAAFGSYWAEFREERRGADTIGGREGEYALATARSTLGARVFLKVAAIASPAGGIVTLVENLPQEGFEALAPEVEAIETGLQLAGAPAPIAPAPEAPAPAPPAAGRGFLGVGARAVVDADLRRLKIQRPHGALVTQLYPGGPAEQAGMQPWDLVVSAEGAPINSPDELIALVGRHHEGDLLTLQVLREGQVGTVRVRLGRPPEQ